MSKNKKIALFVILTLLLQITVYLMLNRQAGQLLSPSFQFGKTYSLPLSLEYTHAHRLSFNNRYLAYISDNQDNDELQGRGTLNIIDLTANKRVFISDHKLTASVLGYEWLPDRNSLVYLVRENTPGRASLQLYTLDLNISSTEIITAKYNRDLPVAADKLAAVEISTYTNHLYFLLVQNAVKPSQQLVRMDIMKTVNIVNLHGEAIQKIAVSNKFGTAYIESIVNSQKSIVALNLGRAVISADPAATLLGCDNDQLYLGRLMLNRLEEIKIYRDPVSAASGTLIWQGGGIPYTDITRVFCTDNKVIIQNPDRIDSIDQNGKHKSMRVNANHIQVISPTGKMMMAISSSQNKTHYTWQAIE